MVYEKMKYDIPQENSEEQELWYQTIQKDISQRHEGDCYQSMWCLIMNQKDII